MKAVSVLYICLELLGTCCLVISLSSSEPTSKYYCHDHKCARNYDFLGEDKTNIQICKLTCEKGGSLWPLPSGKVELGEAIVEVDPSQIFFSYPEDDYLTAVWKIFVSNIRKDHRKIAKSGITVTITAEVGCLTCQELNYETDENYKLKLQANDTHGFVKITGSSVFGIRHGLETLSQLFASYKIKGKDRQLVMITEADISDSPYYPHRGLLIDSSRHFLSVKSIERTIDAMAASKLNILHWHITDSHSFPLKLPSVPQLAQYGSYSDDEVYSESDVEHLKNYAKLRGVRILGEFDAPAHAGNGWQFGPKEGLGNLSLFINVDHWREYCGQPPCGQLNPVNENLYDVLSLVYKDFARMFSPNDLFHMGGDEIFFQSWRKSDEVSSWMTRHKIPTIDEGFLKLWGEFQDRALDIWDTATNKSSSQIILWSSHLTEASIIKDYLDPQRYIIETWVSSTSSLPTQLARLGYKVIMATSNAWYLDHGFWGDTQYSSWTTAYNNKLPNHSNIIGGEVCMWGELVDEQNLDQRIWPRASAAAERMWSNPMSSSYFVGGRFFEHRLRLVRRGIGASPVTPQSCVQNTGQCL